MPSFVRARGGSGPMSAPRNSIVPDVAGTSPEITLNSVVLPAPFGPRTARLSPCATSRSTSRTAWRPPNRRPTPRRRRIGSALGATAVASTVNDLLAEVEGLVLPDPRQAPLLALRVIPIGCRRGRAERAAERLVDVRDPADRLHRQRPVRLL